MSKFIKLTNSSQRPLAVNPDHIAMVMPVNAGSNPANGIQATIIFHGMPVAMLDTQKVVRPEMINVLESFDEIMNLIDAA
jgi:hypothetical protein